MVQTQNTATEKIQRRKREILEAASVVFRRKGLHATGMRDIAAEIDMHAGNIYYYFSNKQELLAFCQQQALSGLLTLSRAVAASGDTAAEKIKRIIVGHVELLNQATPGSLAHLEVEALDEPWRRRLQQQRDEYEEMIRDILRDGVRGGEFRPLDSGMTGRAMLGALNWTVKWFRVRGPKTAAEVGEQFADLFLGGILSSEEAVQRESAR